MKDILPLALLLVASGTFAQGDPRKTDTTDYAGTIRDMAPPSCQIEHTVQRTGELEDWIKG